MPRRSSGDSHVSSVSVSGCGIMMHEAILYGIDKRQQTTKLPEDQTANIERGVTTRQDVERMFGKPDSQTTRPGGELVWIYHRGGAPSWIPGGRTSFQQNLMIHFDGSGTVKDYSFTSGTLKPLLREADSHWPASGVLVVVHVFAHPTGGAAFQH